MGALREQTRLAPESTQQWPEQLKRLKEGRPPSLTGAYFGRGSGRRAGRTGGHETGRVTGR